MNSLPRSVWKKSPSRNLIAAAGRPSTRHDGQEPYPLESDDDSHDPGVKWSICDSAVMPGPYTDRCRQTNKHGILRKCVTFYVFNTCTWWKNRKKVFYAYYPGIGKSTYNIAATQPLPMHGKSVRTKIVL